MTRAATRFVGLLTFEALSGRQVLRSLWRPEYSFDPQHIRVTEKCDAVLLAPASANLIAKLACGLADDLLSTLMTAVTSPVLMAPAMNQAMWKNPIVQSNLARLREHGYQMVGPAEGWQACRSVGMGRLEEPPVIIDALAALLRQRAPRTE
jgi:phosphopantothenoylcysteine decarboxylase/phosphopantothenate--cysteine ligase